MEKFVLELEVYGFTLVEEVLSAEEVADMKKVLIRLNEEVGEELLAPGACRHVSNLPTLDPIFFPIVDHPKILPILEHVLDKSLILGSLNSRIVRPGDDAQGFHSDIPREMLNMASPVMMNTVWLLDDFSPENGGTRVVPGTHKSGLAGPPAGFEVKYYYQPVAKAGSVLVFNGQCWHAGGANRSDHNRHGLFSHYRKRMLMFQYDPHTHFPADWFDQLTPRQKQLMRMGKGLGAPHAADVQVF
ncbi:MAG: phytanoyl-CoA dioxygenase family protein [candidate division Zixibacteria bacterium]|nr:phytanoyl-CoA dioxygenase family protein [candidate division Zixibacteria bacterium]